MTDVSLPEWMIIAGWSAVVLLPVAAYWLGLRHSSKDARAEGIEEGKIQGFKSGAESVRAQMAARPFVETAPRRFDHLDIRTAQFPLDVRATMGLDDEPTRREARR